MKKILISAVLLFLINSLFLLAIVSVSAPVETGWNAKKPLPVYPLANTDIVVLNDKIYVISNTQNTRYDPKGDTWKTLPPMHTPRFTRNIAYQDKIYCIGDVVYPGGISVNLDVVEVYDPFTNNWSRKASIPNNAGSLQPYVVNEQLFVITYSGAMYLYDPSVDSWGNKTALPINAVCEASCVVNEQLFIITLDRGMSRELYMYDPVVDSWTKKAQPPQFRPMLAAIDDKIIGLQYVDNENQVGIHIYDSKTNVWSERNMSPKQGIFHGDLISVIGVTSGVYAPKQAYVFGYVNLPPNIAKNDFIDKGTIPIFTWVYDPENNDWLTAETLLTHNPPFNSYSEKLVVIDDIFYLMGRNVSFDSGNAPSETDIVVFQYVPANWGSCPKLKF